jgi:hypothetical protein
MLPPRRSRPLASALPVPLLLLLLLLLCAPCSRASADVHYSVRATCSYQGIPRAPKQEFPAGDGCNTCKCLKAGLVVCTKVNCVLCAKQPCIVDSDCVAAPSVECCHRPGSLTAVPRTCAATYNVTDACTIFPPCAFPSPMNDTRLARCMNNSCAMVPPQGAACSPGAPVTADSLGCPAGFACQPFDATSVDGACAQECGLDVPCLVASSLFCQTGLCNACELSAANCTSSRRFASDKCACVPRCPSNSKPCRAGKHRNPISCRCA